MAKKTDTVERLNTGIENVNAKKVAEELNKILADEFVLYIKTLKFHWNIEGRNFHALHLFSEEQYNELRIIIDEVAERIRKVGHFANGSMEQCIADASLQEHTKTGRLTEEMMSELLEGHESIIRKSRELIEDFDKKYEDEGSADFITAVMQKHEEMAWMLRASTRE